PYLAHSLNWMIGNWEGEGKRGDTTFSSDLEVSPILDETSLLLKRNSTGGYREAMLLGHDMNSKKNVVTLYDNRYHTGLYTCDVGTNELNCTQVVSVQGYASNRIYRLMQDGSLVFSIQRKDPQNQNQKVLEIVFKKRM
ncbi:hypothetical protein L0152_05835, partial [bacterium]|nr:hypothetical protein [bacterium]